MKNKVKKLANSANKKRFISNFMALSVLRGFQFLIPLVTLPYLVRTIGIEKFGLVNFALSLSFYFGSIIQFGFGITATREIARHRDDPINLSQIYSATLTASGLLALVCACSFCVIVFSFEIFYSNIMLYLFTLVFIVFQRLFPVWFFHGMEKMKYITFLMVGTNAIFLATLFMFVKHQDDFVLVPLLHASAAMITFLFAIIIINKQFKVSYTVPRWSEIKTIYAEGRHAFVGQLAPNLYNNSAVFLLGLFTNNTAVGLYTAATKVTDAIVSLGYILSNTFFPYLSRNLSNHKSFQKIMFSCGLILTLFILIFADIVAEFMFTDANIDIAMYIQWLSLSILFSFVFLTYNTNYLMINGNEILAKNITLYVSILSFFITVIMIHIFEVVGAIIAVVNARFMMSFLSFYFYKKVER